MFNETFKLFLLDSSRDITLTDVTSCGYCSNAACDALTHNNNEANLIELIIQLFSPIIISEGVPKIL